MDLTHRDHGITSLIVHTKDYSVTRLPLPRLPPSVNSDVASKDVTISPAIWARLYLPPQHSQSLPLVIYFHGGGFVFCNADTLFFHAFCERMAEEAGALVVSVDYRLAPEHRIPAAYEDAFAALNWVMDQKNGGEPWLFNHADFSRCFLCGDSAGANIVYHLGIRIKDLDFRINGLVLIQPFFGGVERTAMEIEMAEDKYLPIRANDLLWKLALPAGVDRDDPACNPLVIGVDALKQIQLPKILVILAQRDPMNERQLKFVEMLKSAGKIVNLVELKDAFHGAQLFKSKHAASTCDELGHVFKAQPLSRL